MCSALFSGTDTDAPPTFSPHSCPANLVSSLSPRAGEEIDVQRGEVTCPRSLSLAVKEAAPGALLLVTVLCCLHMWVRTLLPLTDGETKAAGDQMPYRNVGTFLTCGWLKAEAGSAGALSRRRNFSIPNRASYGGGGMEPGSLVLFLYVSWPWALGRLALSGGGGAGYLRTRL